MFPTLGTGFDDVLGRTRSRPVPPAVENDDGNDKRQLAARQISFINRGQPNPRHVAYKLQRRSSINVGLVLKDNECPFLGVRLKPDPEYRVGLRGPPFSVNCRSFNLLRHPIKVEPADAFRREVILQQRPSALWIRDDLPEQGVVLPERRDLVRLPSASDRNAASTGFSGRAALRCFGTLFPSRHRQSTKSSTGMAKPSDA